MTDYIMVISYLHCVGTLIGFGSEIGTTRFKKHGWAAVLLGNFFMWPVMLGLKLNTID